MDKNKDNTVDDQEWIIFYDQFLEPFQQMDTDIDWKLSTAEMLKAFEDQPYFKQINQGFKDIQEVELLAFYMDTTNFNLIHYIFLRRLNVAWKQCGEGSSLSPTQINCALAITVPRTQTLEAASEKAIYRSAIILVNGYDNGQQSTLPLSAFTQIAFIYSYFAEYEISFNEPISQNAMTRACQEGVFPFWFNQYMAKMLFSNRDNVYFNNFAGFYWSVKTYIFASGGAMSMQYDEFKKLLDTKIFPDRL